MEMVTWNHDGYFIRHGHDYITVCRDLNWVWQIKLLILITLLMPSVQK